jgi:MFS family permease
MPAPRYKWYVVGMLWWICFFNYADRQAIFSVFPLLEKEFGLTLEQLGWLGSSFGLVYGLCAPFAGRVVDRVPEERDSGRAAHLERYMHGHCTFTRLRPASIFPRG